MPWSLKSIAACVIVAGSLLAALVGIVLLSWPQLRFVSQTGSSADGTLEPVIDYHLDTWNWLHADHITASPDETLFAIGENDGHIRVIDLAQRRELARYSGHTTRLQDLRFSADGKLLVSVGADGLVLLWDIALAKSDLIYRNDAVTVNTAILPAHGRAVLLADSFPASFLVVDRERRGAERRIPLPHQTVQDMAFAPAAFLVVLAFSTDCGFEVEKWDTVTWQCRGRFGSPSFKPTRIALNRSGCILAIAKTEQSVVELWSVESMKVFG